MTQDGEEGVERGPGVCAGRGDRGDAPLFVSSGGLRRGERREMGWPLVSRAGRALPQLREEKQDRLRPGETLSWANPRVLISVSCAPH